MIIHAILLTGIVITALLAIKLKDLLACAVLLGAMSLLLSLEFYLLQAPDVAITEAAVGAGLGTAIFVVAVMKTRRYEE
ncbi:MAG: DUF4040 domain-containing protein [Candidatus Diapherotrites archaeon]|nr:DUF4040 domain-containing protein [Candidatus Diapherotrites archaeon]